MSINLLLFSFLFQQPLFQGVGINFGSFFSKGAVLTIKKPFLMVEDTTTKNKTPVILTLCKDNRYFEQQAKGKLGRNNCVSFQFPILSQFSEYYQNQKHMQEIQSIFRNELQQQKDEHGIFYNIPSQFLPVLQGFTDNMEAPVESVAVRQETIFSMMVRQMMDNANRTAESEVQQTVFTIHDNGMSIEDRKKLLSSLKLAKIKPTAFIVDNTASAIMYQAKNSPDSKASSKNFLFVDIGQLSTKISFIELATKQNDDKDASKGVYQTVKVLTDKIYYQFSGQIIDHCLSNYSLKKGLKKLNQDNDLSLELSFAQYQRLLQESQRSKEALSANQSTSISMDSFINDLPFNVQLTRNEFNEQCSYVFQRLKEIYKDFKALMGDNKVDSLQLLGGISRIPIVQKMIEEIFQIKPDYHMNGDDSPALGSSYYSASLSPSYKIKRVDLYDGPNYEILCEIKTEENTIKDKHILFPYKTNYGTKSVLNLDKQEKNFKIFLYEESSGYQAEISFDNLEKKLEEIKNKKILSKNVEVEIMLDYLGLPYIKGAYLNITEQFVETYYVKEKVKKEKKDKKEAEKKEEQKKEENQTDQKDEEKKDDQKKDDKKDEQKKYEKKEEEYEEISVPKTRDSQRNLKIKLSFKYTDNAKTIKNKSDLYQSQKQFIVAFEEYEKNKRIFSESKNQLQTYVSKLKEIVNDENQSIYLQDSEKQSFLDKAEQIDDFVTYMKKDTKLEEIKNEIVQTENLLRPFYNRSKNHLQREFFYESIWKKLNETTKEIEQIVQRKKWIKEEEVQGVHKFIYEKKETIKKIYDASKDFKKHEDPEFNEDFIEKVKNEINAEIKKLWRIPKPQDEKSAQENSDKEKTSQESTSDEDGSNQDSDKEKKNENLDEMFKNFDWSKFQGDPAEMEKMKEQLKEMQKNMNKETTAEE